MSCVITAPENVEYLHHPESYLIVLYRVSSTLTPILWRPPVLFSSLLIVYCFPEFLIEGTKHCVYFCL